MKQFFKQIGKERTFVVAELFIVYFVLGAGLIQLGSVLPNLRIANHLNYSAGGTLLSVQSIGYLLVGLFSGAAAARLHMKRAYLLLYIMLPIGFMMLIAGGSQFFLMLAMFLVGIAKGSITDYNNRIVNIYSNGDAKPLNMLHACFALGACLAPILVLLCNFLGNNGWIISMMISLAFFIIALIIGFFMKISDGDLAVSSDSNTQAASNGFAFFKNKLFLETMTMSFFYQAIEATMMGWLTSFFIDSHVIDHNNSQLVTSLLWISLLAGRFLCSIIASYVKPWQMLIAMCTGMLLFLILLVSTVNLGIMIFATVGLGLSMSGMYATSVANASTVFTRYSASMGFYVTITGTGAAVGPAIVGLIANTTSLRFGFLALIIAAAFCILAAVLNAKNFSKHS